MERYDLPPSWEWTTLGEVCVVNPSMSRPLDLANDMPVSFIPMAAVDGQLGAIVEAETRPISEVWKGYKRFAEGDVIFARITPCMENGKAAIAVGLCNGIGLGSTEFHVLRATTATTARWLLHFVHQQVFRDEASRAMTGTAGQLRVPEAYLHDAAIPLPPLPEQRRIVERIEALFAHVRAAREALDGIPALIKHFRQAVLAAAFRGDLTSRHPDDEPSAVLLERIRVERRRKWEEDLRAKGKDPAKYTYEEPAPPDRSKLPELPEGWAWASVGELLRESLANGRSVQSTQRGFPVLRLTAIRSGRIDPDEAKMGEWTEDEAKPYFIEPGDFLIARGNGSLHLVGRGGLVEDVPFAVAYPDTMIRVRLHSDEVLPAYFAVAWDAPVIRRQIEVTAHTTAGIHKINQQQILSYAVPLPPARYQRRLVHDVESTFALIELSDRAISAAHRQLDDMEQAILARAFRGELVPQDPSDEPASVLLARIRAEREANSTGKRKGVRHAARRD